MLKTYHGSCHCQAVRYEADIDFSQGTGKCNCSICSKSRNWSVSIKPDAFRLLSGEGEMNDYQWNSNQIHRLFCRHCGVNAYGYGHLEEVGGDFVSISVMSLDDATPDDLLSGPVTLMDGRHNNWWNPPAETRLL